MEPTLKMCTKCQLHAVFVGTNESKSPTFDSKPFARAMIEDGIKLGFLKPEDREGLEKQIAESPLPDTAEEVSYAVMDAVITWNIAVSENPDDPLVDQVECIVEFLSGTKARLKTIVDSLQKSSNARNN